MSDSIIQMRNKHAHALEEMLHHPELIGVQQVTWDRLEMPFHKHGKQVGEVDLMLHSSYDGKMYVVEYKCNDSDHSRLRASEQLERAAFYIPKEYGFKTDILLYVYDDFINLEYKHPNLFIPRPKQKEALEAYYRRLDRKR